MAQMMRASLLATAATTTLKGRRATRPSIHVQKRASTAGRKPDQRSCAVHQLSAQIAVTPFADPEQPFPTTGRVLARRETEPRGKAAAVREDLRVDDRRYHCSRDYGADTRDCCQPPGGLVVTSLPQQASVEVSDLHLDRPQVLHLKHQKFAGHRRQARIVAI